MWIVFAFGSAIFAGLTAILAKCGIRRTDSTVATAIRTIVVLAFAWAMVFLTGTQNQWKGISQKTWIFLILSGVATGASWLCYFKALKLGDINKVVPIDKSSVILTILLAWIIFHETITWQKGAGVILIAAGTFFMIEKKENEKSQEPDEKEGKHSWLLYAVCSAVFASLTSILGKMGIEGVDSNLGTAIRTGVVLVMAWLMVLIEGKTERVKEVSVKELFYIVLSGIATGASWLCYYRALQEGQASLVVPIDKLSIVISVGFSYFIFHEKLSRKAFWGLISIVCGTMAMLS